MKFKSLFWGHFKWCTVCEYMPGVGLLIRVVGLESEDPEFKSHLVVELIPGGVNSACHPSEFGKTSASLLVSCVGVATRPGLYPIAKETAKAAPTLCTEYGPNEWIWIPIVRRDGADLAHCTVNGLVWVWFATYQLLDSWFHTQGIAAMNEPSMGLHVKPASHLPAHDYYEVIKFRQCLANVYMIKFLQTSPSCVFLYVLYAVEMSRGVFSY